MIVLETERLILRRWREADRAPFARMNADPRVMEHFPAPLSTEESDGLVKHIEEQFQRHGFAPCAAELRDGGRFIGFIGLSVPSFDAHFTPCVEIGWRLAADCWGRGLATEGARAVVRYAFDSLGLRDLVSFTVPANVRSRRVMEKLAMARDPAEDFEHPRTGSRHVLYRLSNGL
jgi:RimJ/RimL family protein N-acetyltransferase